jgi:hypothetical protein
MKKISLAILVFALFKNTFCVNGPDEEYNKILFSGANSFKNERKNTREELKKQKNKRCDEIKQELKNMGYDTNKYSALYSYFNAFPKDKDNVYKKNGYNSIQDLNQKIDEYIACLSKEIK